MAKILFEFEGLTAARVKTVMKKIDNCGFNLLSTHVQNQCATFDKELTCEEQQENALDIQPIQSNGIFIKCVMLDSQQNYSGKGDINKISKRRDTSPFIKMMIEDRKNVAPLEIIIPTESPIEDETGKFDIKVRMDIVFYNPSKNKMIGFYNKKANFLWISDIIHNPLRSEFLLDRVVSYVYELNKCGSLDVITPIFNKYEKDLANKGLQDARLWWTGFEDKNDTTVVDGKVDVIKMIEQDPDSLIKEGVDIFFMRSLKKSGSAIEAKIEKCEAKLTQKVNVESVQVPNYTTLEAELKTIETYLSKYFKGISKEFFSKAKEEFDARRIA